MNNKRYSTAGIIALIILIFLIFESNAVQDGIREGMELLIYSVIPALFPFILVTSVISSTITSRQIPGLKVLGKLCRIPHGAEPVFLLGLIAGYPIGAKTIADMYASGQLNRSAANRLIGFCNNAGPAFIFGVLSQLFTKTSTPFFLWGIHILSAVIVGMILPGRNTEGCQLPTIKLQTFSHNLEQSIRTMTVISAWILIWRAAISLCYKYLPDSLPASLRAIITGLCELTNGCLALQYIANESTRFIIAACLLACGGLCITMQTKSVINSMGMGMYIPGKLLQSAISLLLSIACCRLLYPGSKNQITVWLASCTAGCLFISVIIINRLKIMVAFRRILLYNEEKVSERGN